MAVNSFTYRHPGSAKDAGFCLTQRTGADRQVFPSYLA
jgi:hypothetical protein